MNVITISDDELTRLVQDAVREAIGRVQVKPLEPLYTIDEACELLKKNEHTLYRWANQGIINIKAIGGARYVTGQSLADIINQ